MESSVFSSSLPHSSPRAFAECHGYEGYKTLYEGEISLLRNTIESVKKDHEKQTKRVSKLVVLTELKDMELRSMKSDLEKLQRENITLKALIQRWGGLEDLGRPVAEEGESTPGSTTDSGISGDFTDTEEHRSGNGENFSYSPLDKPNQVKPDIPEGSRTNGPTVATDRLELSTLRGNGAGYLYRTLSNPGSEDASESSGIHPEAQDGQSSHIPENHLAIPVSQTSDLPGAVSEDSILGATASQDNNAKDPRAIPANNLGINNSAIAHAHGSESRGYEPNVFETSKASSVWESKTGANAEVDDRWENIMQELVKDFPALDADRNLKCSGDQEKTRTAKKDRDMRDNLESNSLPNSLPTMSEDLGQDLRVGSLPCPEKTKPILEDPWVRQRQKELLKSFTESFKIKAECQDVMGSEKGSSGGQSCRVRTQEPALPGWSGVSSPALSPKVKLEGAYGSYDFEALQSVYKSAGPASENPISRTDRIMQSNCLDPVILEMPRPHIKQEKNPQVENPQSRDFSIFPGVEKEAENMKESTDVTDLKMGVGSKNLGSPPPTFVLPMGALGSQAISNSEARTSPGIRLKAEGPQDTQITIESCISERDLLSKLPNGVLLDFEMPNDTQPPTVQRPFSTPPNAAPPAAAALSMNTMRARQSPAPARPAQAPSASPRATSGLPYNYEKIREVVVRRLPKDISYKRLLSGVRGGPLEAAVINWTSLEARLIFMEPEAARTCYQHLKKEGLWVPTDEPHSRATGNDRSVYCDLGGFLWTANSAKPRPSLVFSVWKLGKTRTMAVTNLPRTCTLEEAKGDVLQLLSQPGGERVVFESVEQLVSPIARPGETAMSITFKFSAISYALRVESMLESLPKYKDAVCVYLPDTCGKLINKEPPSTWIGSPESHRTSSQGSLELQDIKAENEDLLDRVDPNFTGFCREGPLSPVTLPKTLEHKGNPEAKRGTSPNLGNSSWGDYTSKGSSTRPIGASWNWRAANLNREHEKSPKITDPGKDIVENGLHMLPEENFLQRCVCLTNLPQSLDYPVLFQHISGGAIEHTRIFLPSGDEKTSKAFVVFVEARAAKKYKDFIAKSNVIISGVHHIKVTDHIPAYMYDHLRVVSPRAIQASGLSRCLWIHGLHPTVALSEVKEDLEAANNHHELKWETAATYPIPGKPNKVNTVIRFPTMLSAIWAKGVLDRHSKYLGCLTRYLTDPCERPLTKTGTVSTGLAPERS